MNHITDGVIAIRPFALEDAPAHLAGEDDEQVKWLSGGKGTLAGVEEWIVRSQSYWRHGGPVFTFAIVDASGKLLGMVEANTDATKVEGIQRGDANISYGLYPFARGSGYATRAVNLATALIASKGIRRAVIRVHPNNVKSLRVPKRCGFVEERTMTTRTGEPLVVFVKALVS